MKKTFILISAFLLTFALSNTSDAQGSVPCVDRLDQFFSSGVDNGNYVTLNRLGSSPQFGRIRRHTSASAFAHLKNAHRRNRTHRAEIDRLLMALGYDGITDPSFAESSITPEILYSGTNGWIGARGNKYIKATFGRDFEGFRIASKDGPCYVYIMKTCGNIFHPGFPVCDGSQPCPECNNFSAWSSNNAASPFCNCTPCPECQDTMEQNVTLTGAGNISSGDCVMGTKEVNLVASYGGVDLCIGKVSVPVNVSYEYEASGTTTVTEMLNVDNQDGNALSAIDLTIPVNLDFNVEEGQTSFGNNGAIKMDVTAKRFKVLKKFYGVCVADMASDDLEGLSASEVDNASSSMVAMKGDGVIGKKKQTLFFTGSDAISEVVSKEHSNTVTVIAHSKKTGKLSLGESADRYLCLGQYNVAGASALKYMLTGSSTLTHATEVCDDDGTQASEKNINLPIDLNASFTEQEMKVGDDGKVYIEISETQYNKMGKRFSKCCSNGDSSCF